MIPEDQLIALIRAVIAEEMGKRQERMYLVWDIDADAAVLDEDGEALTFLTVDDAEDHIVEELFPDGESTAYAIRSVNSAVNIKVLLYSDWADEAYGDELGDMDFDDDLYEEGLDYLLGG